MIGVKLLAYTDIDPVDLAAHAAKVCYSSKLPPMGSQMDVEKNFLKKVISPPLNIGMSLFQSRE